MNNKKDIELNLKKYSIMSLNNLFKELDSKENGLTEDIVLKKREIDGYNIIDINNKNKGLKRIKEALINPFNIVLLVIAVITFFSDIIISLEKDYATFIVIITLVIISSLISFIQSERSNKAVEKLSKMVVNTSNVKRDNKFIEINMEDIVVGDIIFLAAGDMIPADVRFLTTKDTFISQSSLTGEANPSEKFSDIVDEVESITDLSNIGFMGTNIISGTATAIVIAIGNDTYFGSMATSLTKKTQKNSFEIGIDAISKLLIRFMLIIIPIIIIINIITKIDLLNSILFAVAIAVGLTPEMLPVILSTTLAKGAINMSKHKVIVKNMASIQTFGEMDILCTDKTGTLTEDKIILEKYINIYDKEDSEVLKYSFLNSYFQTSLKNMIDLAIINRAKKENINNLVNEYKIIDEIPYDFNRRRMSVVLNYNNHNNIITKGSVEEVISVCKYINHNNKKTLLTEEINKKLMNIYDKYTLNGIRMLGVAIKECNLKDNIYSIKDESDMTFIGFIGFLDPPKESAKEAIKVLDKHGVRTVVLTGDSKGVALIVCNKVGINTNVTLSGLEVSNMNNEELKIIVEKCNLFYKLSPLEKERVVKILQSNNHTVGYMGDGINDALPLKQSDVGVSVDNAVDIAKETANIILLEKDLLVLEQGVILGRRTFGNIIKYIKMTISGNFGNTISVVVASIFLPFLPMLPIHILVQNLLCDFSQMGIPFDDVDREFIDIPQKWNAKSIKNFMFVLGPISSIFDILCFIILFFIIKANTIDLAPIFQCGWFVFGVISQVLVIYMIRTSKKPFIESIPSRPLVISTLSIVFIALLISFTNIGIGLDMIKLPLIFIFWLLILLIGYSLTIEITKKFYIKKYNKWL